jgi:hypothetical protein
MQPCEKELETPRANTAKVLKMIFRIDKFLFEYLKNGE